MRTALVVGILFGLAIGLAYAWLIDPVELGSADPYHLDARYRDVWIVMSAEAYAADGDWTRTSVRLDWLRDPNLKQTIVALFDRVNADGPNPQARALARLAAQLGETTASMVVYLTTPAVTPTPRLTPISILPSLTPAAPAPTATDSFPTP